MIPDYLQQASAQYKLTKAKALSLQDADPVAWIERHMYIPETNAPVQLQPYHKAMIREALRKDSDGLYVYSTVLWSDTKKSAKTLCASAVALYLAWHNAYETIRIIGNDQKQSDSRTFFYIRRAIQLNKALRSLCKVVRYTVRLPNETTIQAVPVDPKGEAGGGDLFTCFTELWGMKNEASQQLWSETTLSPLKFGKSLRWCESYAGFVGESPILENLYDTLVKQGEPITLVECPDLPVYRNGRMLGMWNKTPRCPWQTAQYYASEKQTLTPSEYSRMHENEWSAPSSVFVPAEWWQACSGVLPTFSKYVPMVIAMDAAVTGDCFGVVAVSRVKDVVYVRYARSWTPPKNGKINFNEIEAEIRRLAREYNIECVCYDPYQLEDMANRLTLEGVAYMRAFAQGAPRLIADKLLYDTIRERRLVHSNEPTLAEHVANADAETANDNRLRLVKRRNEHKIDLVVALSMATCIAVELELA